MTVCPECGEDFDTTDSVKELPLQALAQECPSCGYTVDIAIVNYPDNTYEVLAPARRGDVCIEAVSNGLGLEACGNDAMIRRQKIGRPMEGRCAEHMYAHRETAMDFRDELS